jgi:glycosyltransferase involved in cell wall biosynthesis
MVTKGRLELMKASIQCYLNQTYKNKNMVILSQGSEDVNDAIKQYLKGLDASEIMFYTAPPNITLGAMRNCSIEIANGDIICQWDDDDLSHHDRLRTQYDALRCDSRRVASMFCAFLKYYKTSGEIYWCDWSGERLKPNRFICNTLMLRKDVFGQRGIYYPETGPQCNFEEDFVMLQKLLHIGEVGPVFDGHKFLYVYHGSNVYHIEHHNWTLNTSTGKKVMGVDELLERKDLIEETLRSIKISDSVKVRSLDSIAFTCQLPSHL